MFKIVSGGNAFNDFRLKKTYSINQGTSSLLSALTLHRTNDFRFASMIVANGARKYSTKWDADVISPPIIRLAEIYLIHSESAARLNTPDLTAASDSYNAVRTFFSDPSIGLVNFLSASEAFDSLEVERRVEMAFEGDRYHELRRLKKASFGEVKSGATIIREAKPSTM